jgi:ribosome-associated protein
MLIISPTVKIRYSEFQFSYVRSSGPGGQNVNKVNSKAVLRWNILESECLAESTRARILDQLASKLTLEGEIIISSDRFRDQTRNREDCVEKLRVCLAHAVAIPKPRKETKPSRSSQRRVKEQKSRLSAKKSLRRSPRRED